MASYAVLRVCAVAAIAAAAIAAATLAAAAIAATLSAAAVAAAIPAVAPGAPALDASLRLILRRPASGERLHPPRRPHARVPGRRA